MPEKPAVGTRRSLSMSINDGSVIYGVIPASGGPLMSRHAICAGVLIYVLASQVAAQDAPKADKGPKRLPPAVDRAWDTAEKKVRKNRELYDSANAKALEGFQKELEKIKPPVNVDEFVLQFQQKAIVALDENARPPALPPPDKDVLIGPNGHRYKFLRESVSWDDAKKRCEDLGGHLLALETRAEHDFISNWVKTGVATNKDQFGDGASVWMGAKEVEVKPGQKEWQWITGQPFTFSAWRGHHPHRVEANRDFLTLALLKGDWVNFWGQQQPDTFIICEWDK